MYTVFAGNTSEKCERDDVFEVCERLRALGPLSIHDGTGFILVDGVKNTPSTHPAAPVSAPELAPAPEPRTGSSYAGAKQWRVRCSQCEALVINGIATHERGCPNAPRRDGCEDES